MLTLSPDQQAALDRILAWAKAPHGDITLGGLAGTGKTTILRQVVDAIGERARVMAPTGRAAQVLRRKGVRCETIHSTVLDYNGTYEDRAGREQISWRDKDGVEVPAIWVVDEASMVSTDLCDTIHSHRVPVCWVGDHGQLAPIGGDPGLMRDPQIRLEQIHRQCAGSPILAVAHAARNGIAPTLGDDGVVTVTQRGSLQAMVERWIRDDVQVACGRNRTRIAINMYWRIAMGYRARVVEGEKLIVLFNDRGRGVYNGTMLTVRAVKAETEHGWTVDVEDDGGQLKTFSIWNRAIGGGEWKSEEKPSDHVVVDYAYAITVHKSQGGSWKKFAVVDEVAHGWDHARWRYTALTRAEQRLWVHL